MIVEATGTAAGIALGWAGFRWLRTGGYRYDDERGLPLRHAGWVPVVAPVAAALSAAAHHDEPALAVVLAVAAVVLVLLSAIDVDVRRLPDRWTWPSAAVSVVAVTGCAAVAGEPGDAGRALVAAVALAGFYLLGALAPGGGMGLGDVKLALTLGLLLGYLGWEYVVLATLLAFVSGAVYGLWLLARGAGRKATMPFGPFMALGAVLTWCLPLAGRF